jgi:hypothetical protein
MLISTTGCIHSTDTTDLEYRVKILEKRMQLLELDLQYLLEDECITDEEVENTIWEFSNISDPIGF